MLFAQGTQIFITLAQWSIFSEPSYFATCFHLPFALYIFKNCGILTLYKTEAL